MQRVFVSLLVCHLLLMSGCGDGSDGSSNGSNTNVVQIPAVGPWNAGVALPEEPQVGGDPVRGREILLGGDFMTCGIPFKLWNNAAFQQFIAEGFGGTKDAPRIADRPGKNAAMPYFMNVFTAENGAEVVNANCLLCHGGQFNGELVVGLGNPAADFTEGAGGGSGGIPLTDELLNLFGLNGAEKAQLRKTYQRAAVLGPLTNMRTVGMNPAEMFAVILMVHHDRDTLEWSDEEVTPLTIYDHDGSVMNNDDVRITSDPPPWWRAHKKNALFYNGMARGDHRGSMAYATSVCVDDVERAQEVDEMFKDIQAFITTIRPPAYPFEIDDNLASRGHDLFIQNCAGCHGTYSANEEEETYPSLLIPLPVIGTDPVIAEAGVVHAPQLVEWYNGSFYGSVTRMVPNDPFPGYMPPPLDGIWATAPYLHNGSVPTVELMLNSSARPTYWKRVDYDTTNFDEEALGWPYIELDYPQALAPAAERKFVYDTTYFSQSNRGHIFGDHLTAEERRTVIEYLKTL
jgi:mono/diheme cytochrome c family protein